MIRNWKALAFILTGLAIPTVALSFPAPAHSQEVHAAWHGDLSGYGGCSYGQAIVHWKLTVSNPDASYVVSDGHHSTSGHTSGTAKGHFNEGLATSQITVTVTANESWEGGIKSGPQSFKVYVGLCDHPTTTQAPTTTTVPATTTIPVTTTVATTVPVTTTVATTVPTDTTVPETTVPTPTTQPVSTTLPSTTVANTTTTTKVIPATTSTTQPVAATIPIAPTSVAPLAFTGTDIGLTAGIGGIVLLTGGGLVIAARRRKQ